MKKFFALCLMFLVAGVLNLSAGYVLTGENVNGESWQHSSATNTFTEDENGDLILTGVTISGDFKVTLDQKSWFGPVYNAKLSAGVPLVLTTDDGSNCSCATTYTNSTIKLTKLSNKAIALEIISTDTQDVELDQLGEDWGLIGAFNNWSGDLALAKKEYGVYEAWIDQATVNGLVGQGFKFRTGEWVADFGSTGLSYGLNQWNILQRGGADITTFVQPTETYDKYLLTFCVEGSAAKFRIDGYKQATQPVTVFYESFDACNSTGGNDGLFSGKDTANGTFTSDNNGWVVASKNGGNKCGKFGSSSKSGELTSPALGLTGDATLTFKAAPWGTDGKSLGLSISSGQLSESSLTMTANQWTEYTIKITGATPDATLTFTPAKRFFLDEVKVVQGDASADMKAAEITLNGVMKDAETAYYHGSLTNPTVTVTLPAGATYMDVEVDNSGYITESRKNQTSDCTIPFYNAGNYTVRVTAYGEGVYSVASKDIAIETVSNVNTFDELINKGEGAIGALGFSPTVVAHVGKYLYLEGYDMWDGIRSSALVYASLDKTYKKGDVLQGFIATVAYYNGNPQLIPLTTSLGDPFGMSEPYVYEVEAGDAWKAFAVEANVNKYVRVKNAPVTADAVDGVAVYTKNLGVNMPEDLTKKYDVEGFINNFKGTIQIQPISFTAEEIKPFTYTEIVPANNTEVTSLSEIKITFPYDVTYDATVAMGILVMDGANMITPTVAVEGAVATLTFDAITAYGSKPSLMVMEGAFKEATSGVGCQLITASWTIPTPPVRNDYMPTSINPADGSVVEELKNIAFYFDDADPEITDNGYYYAKDYITVKDANGNVVESNPYLKVAKASSGGYGILFQPNKGSNITTPGTYVITFAEGLISDVQYYDTYGKKGRINPEFTITYTIKAAALEAPTVDPANGAEVENLNTITLTFAEAVTANAEAGAISIVNTSDAGSDYAKEIRVAISEDGLTATITCVPGYLDRWAPGKTYKLNIPAGYFVATSGAASEALEYSWTIATPKFTYVAVDPAQGEVTELSEILISFAQKTWGNGSNPTLNLVDANGNVVTTASTNREKDANGNWFAIKATLKDKVTTPGTYTLVVPENSFTDVDFGDSGNKSAAFDLTWTVTEPDPNTYDLALTSDPANGATVTELKTIKISAADASVIAMPTTEAQSAGWFTIKDAEGNSYNYTAKVGVGIEINIEGATALGTYTVVVPAKSFVDAMTMTAASKRYNAEMILTYTLQEEEEVDNTVYDLTPVTISPANGTEVETLDVVYVQFPENVYDCLWGALDYSKDFVKVSDDKGNTYEAKLNKGEYSDEYYIYVKDATQPGTYTIVVPKALVFDAEYADTFESGHANPEFTLTYTLVAPVVEDFTPVVNPAAGNVTKEQIKTTVLSFESPIASFDTSDVRYAKNFGSVWYKAAGSYTISEDKLSLTINWDFAPEVGLTYTLELPAGCIVLENGAKNLFTQVKYTVVAGPKDLAEFVVPEGINGYINYDETDVNAWAPEFPFTVSTTAYNTVAFAAELPSLPAGITAMEVIDENGEVIATLNQDGVAPLADGEIYYVKGETTKEYADGAELKFRFRFTHLGVSETIQFSYIVAGGNITSIADVELDGNVIVRGNDIIAPEGAAIFTVSGIRVPAEGLAPGVYVVVLGNQAVKVMVK